MRTTIDAAGRIVVPKGLRDALQLRAGQAVDIVLADGRLEIEIAPADVHVEEVEGLPIAVADEALPPLTATVVRETIEATRR